MQKMNKNSMLTQVLFLLIFLNTSLFFSCSRDSLQLEGPSVENEQDGEDGNNDDNTKEGEGDNPEGEIPPEIKENPSIKVSETELDFGDVEINTESVKKTISLENTGDKDVEIDKISLTNCDLGNFQINQECISIKIGEKCEIEVTFVPKSEGKKNDKISILAKDESIAEISAELKGNGINKPEQPSIPKTIPIPIDYSALGTTINSIKTNIDDFVNYDPNLTVRDKVFGEFEILYSTNLNNCGGSWDNDFLYIKNSMAKILNIFKFVLYEETPLYDYILKHNIKSFVMDCERKQEKYNVEIIRHHVNSIPCLDKGCDKWIGTMSDGLLTYGFNGLFVLGYEIFKITSNIDSITKASNTYVEILLNSPFINFSREQLSLMQESIKLYVD